MPNKENDNHTIYDERALYESEIKPLLLQLKKICLNKVPFIFSAAVANEKGQTEYIHDGYLTGSAGINLYQDNFEKYLLALRGGHFLAPDVAKSIMPAKYGIKDTSEAEMNAMFEEYDEDGVITEIPFPKKSADSTNSGVEFIGEL